MLRNSLILGRGGHFDSYIAMLSADRLSSADTDDLDPSVVSRPPVAVSPYVPSRYGAGRRLNPFALCASALLVGSLIAALVVVRSPQAHHRPHELHVIDLLPPPPPPPPMPNDQPVRVKSVQPEIVTPVPEVAISPPIVPVVTAPTPPPPEAVIVAPSPPSPPRANAPTDVGDLSSKMISATPPRYPLDSRRKHEEGTVILSVLLGADGHVADISVAQSSGFERLDRAALAAVRLWRWSPTVRSGDAVMVRGLVKIPFLLSR